MSAPRFLPRMKQRNAFTGLGIRPFLSGSFAQRTGDASQPQIFQAGGPSGGGGNDVVDVENCFLPQLGQITILATVSRPLDNRTPHAARDRHFWAARGGPI